ncbi:MAG: ribonuclease HII [Chloroflexi bacterium]|nr:ribonuclease HII [Chloroflexota bacterium]
MSARTSSRPSLEQEHDLWSQGIGLVAGLDEAGRGAWAGPVAAAAVILPPHPTVEALQLWRGLDDSKKLSPRQRERLYPCIWSLALAVGVGLASAAEVDRLNVLQATRLAMQRALAQLPATPGCLLLDHLTLPQVALPQRPIPHGDALVLSIAAASVVAKVTRDRLMVQMAADYPGYGFEQHKGYGTAAHCQALQRLGPCQAHRASYRPVAALLGSAP